MIDAETDVRVFENYPPANNKFLKTLCFKADKLPCCHDGIMQPGEPEFVRAVKQPHNRFVF